MGVYHGLQNVFGYSEDKSSYVFNLVGQHLKEGIFQGFVLKNWTFSRLSPKIWCPNGIICLYPFQKRVSIQWLTLGNLTEPLKVSFLQKILQTDFHENFLLKTPLQKNLQNIPVPSLLPLMHRLASN